MERKKKENQPTGLHLLTKILEKIWSCVLLEASPEKFKWWKGSISSVPPFTSLAVTQPLITLSQVTKEPTIRSP